MRARLVGKTLADSLEGYFFALIFQSIYFRALYGKDSCFDAHRSVTRENAAWSQVTQDERNIFRRRLQCSLWITMDLA